MRTMTFWAGLGAALGVAGCKPAVSTAPSAPAKVTVSAVRTDVAGLGKIVTLTRKPVAAAWQQTQYGDGNFGPSDYQLLAVMKFSRADAEKVGAAARKYGAGRAGEVEVEKWFPAALRKGAVRGANGKLVLRGRQLEADDFARLSLLNGSLMRVTGTDYFVLSLFTS